MPCSFWDNVLFAKNETTSKPKLSLYYNRNIWISAVRLAGLFISKLNRGFPSGRNGHCMGVAITGISQS